MQDYEGHTEIPELDSKWRYGRGRAHAHIFILVSVCFSVLRRKNGEVAMLNGKEKIQMCGTSYRLIW
jgi:hypothetical protein